MFKSGSYDLVIMDTQMSEDVGMHMAAGCSDHLSKPIRKKLFIERKTGEIELLSVGIVNKLQGLIKAAG